MSRKISSEVIILTIIVWIFAPGPAFSADPIITWKVQTPWMSMSWGHKAAINWAEDVFKMSGGRMKIDLRSADSGGWSPEITGNVEKGILDAGYTSPSFMARRFPAAILYAGTPAFFDGVGYFTWMYAYGGKELWQETYGNALKVFPAGMSWAKTGGWGNKEFSSFSDYKGSKIGSYSGTWGKVLSGAESSVVVPPTFIDIYTFLEEGKVDAIDLSTPWTDMSLGLQKFAKYCYFPGLMQIAGFLELQVNNEKWNALPPDLQEIVKGACDAGVSRSLTHWLWDDAQAVRVLQDGGKVKVVKFSKEMQQEILDKFTALYDTMPDKMFQKVWQSQKEFMKVYVPYMKLQEVEATVKLR